MPSEYWSGRWERGEIAFHQPQVNADLRRYWPQLQLPSAARVFVPLCGKSEDMAWLRAQGHTVIGIELAELAVAAFFSEHGLQPTQERSGALQCFRAAGYELYVGDFFDLQAEQLRGVAGVYDRGALIALPPALRQRYAAQLAARLPAASRMLLVTVDYPQEQMPGPPFAVSDAEVRALYGGEFSVRRLASRDLLEMEPRFRERGVQTMAERVSLLERPPAAMGGGAGS